MVSDEEAANFLKERAQQGRKWCIDCQMVDPPLQYTSKGPIHDGCAAPYVALIGPTGCANYPTPLLGGTDAERYARTIIRLRESLQEMSTTPRLHSRRAAFLFGRAEESAPTVSTAAWGVWADWVTTPQNRAPRFLAGDGWYGFPIAAAGGAWSLLGCEPLLSGKGIPISEEDIWKKFGDGTAKAADAWHAMRSTLTKAGETDPGEYQFFFVTDVTPLLGPLFAAAAGAPPSHDPVEALEFVAQARDRWRVAADWDAPRPMISSWEDVRGLCDRLEALLLEMMRLQGLPAKG